jgi:hypothetical protein
MPTRRVARRARHHASRALYHIELRSAPADRARMVHMVLKKGRYWELHESYRDVRGRPRKRFLRYLGRYSASWKESCAPELDGIDWAEIERQECERR